MIDKSALMPGVSRREVWAWSAFDFANSGYTTVVLTAVFNAYFVSVVAADAPLGDLSLDAHYCGEQCGRHFRDACRRRHR